MFRSLLSVLLGICQEVELLGHMLILFLMFQGITVLFSIVAASLYLPTGRAQKSQFLHILLTLSFFFILFFPNNHTNGYAVVSHRGFYLNFPND